jgi:hypothetical protein
MTVYALNLFNIANREEYLAYSKREAAAREIKHRVNGSADYIWHLFDRLDDLRPLLK